MRTSSTAQKHSFMVIMITTETSTNQILVYIGRGDKVVTIQHSHVILYCLLARFHALLWGLFSELNLAHSVYVYHYTLAFKPDKLQRSTLDSRCSF